jgi:hypothetical protein
VAKFKDFPARRAGRQETAQSAFDALDGLSALIIEIKVRLEVDGARGPVTRLGRLVTWTRWASERLAEIAQGASLFDVRDLPEILEKSKRYRRPRLPRLLERAKRVLNQG